MNPDGFRSFTYSCFYFKYNHTDVIPNGNPIYVTQKNQVILRSGDKPTNQINEIKAW